MSLQVAAHYTAAAAILKIMSKVVSKANNETSSIPIRVARLDSRRRSISHSELLDTKCNQNEEDRDPTPVPEERNRLKTSRPTSMYYDSHEDFDRLASEIIDSVRQLEPGIKKTSSSSIVRRSSSGYSSGSASSQKSEAVPRSPRLSFTGLFQRNSTNSKRIDLQTSESKRAQFTQQRSHTGLQIFGGRRRSVAITDDAYDAAMRAAKSHLDLHSESSIAAIDNDKKRSKVSKEPLQRKHFNERPWIELEKLWRGKLKAPDPDLTQDFLSTANKNSAAAAVKKSMTLPVQPPPARKRIEHSRTQVCKIPPPPVPARPKRHTVNGPVIKKAIHLMSNEVLDNWRLQLTDFEEANSKSQEAHFTELLKIW